MASASPYRTPGERLASVEPIRPPVVAVPRAPESDEELAAVACDDDPAAEGLESPAGIDVSLCVSLVLVPIVSVAVILLLLAK
jgi:hypothetical protein